MFTWLQIHADKEREKSRGVSPWVDEGEMLCVGVGGKLFMQHLHSLLRLRLVHDQSNVHLKASDRRHKQGGKAAQQQAQLMQCDRW